MASTADFRYIFWFWYSNKVCPLIHCIIGIIRVSTVAFITINPSLFVDTLLPVRYRIFQSIFKILVALHTYIDFFTIFLGINIDMYKQNYNYNNNINFI